MTTTTWSTTGGTTVTQSLAEQAEASALAAANSAQAAANSASSIASGNEQVKVSSNDSTTGFLSGKIVAGSSIVLSENNDGANETLTISYTGGAGTGLNNVVEDATPELGGDLNLLGYKITTSGNGNIPLAANGSGYVVVEGNTNSGKIVLNCSENSHQVSISAPPHSAAATYDLVLPEILQQGAFYVSAAGQIAAGDLPIADGGTGASTATAALVNLGGLPIAGGTMTGQLVLHTSGIQFSDSTTMTTASSGGGTSALPLLYAGF